MMGMRRGSHRESHGANFKGCLSFVWAVVFAAIYAPGTQAQVTNLHAGQSVDLASYANVSGAGILVGDKLFNDFSYVASDSTGLTNNLLPAGAVTLSALTNMTGFGLSFGAPFHTSGNLLKDFIIKYAVTVTNASFLISDVHMDYNGTVVGNGYNLVTETVFDSSGFGGNQLGQIVVQNPPSIPQTNLTLVAAQPELFVQKDIQLGGEGDGDQSSISIIDQTFSQVAVPEPSSLVLAMAGMFAFLSIRRRK
jgi:PEP-CTERM motif